MSGDKAITLGTLRLTGGTSCAVINGGSAAVIPGYDDVRALLAAGDEGLRLARAAATNGTWIQLDPDAVLVPVVAPGAVFCVGMNYRAHIREMGRELPEHPTLFAKFTRSLAPPFAPVKLPVASDAVDYEGELVVVVGRGGRDIPTEQAHQHIGGYTLMNDVSMRDWQYRSIEWTAGKNFESSTPVGPYVVTPDAVDLERSEIVVTVNGEVRQRAPLADLVFDPATLIADISRFTALEPGDLIATGTPGGVGHAMDPPSYLRDGDVVEVTVDGIGTLSTRFVA